MIGQMCRSYGAQNLKIATAENNTGFPATAIKNLHLLMGYGARKLLSELTEDNWKRF